MTNLEWLKTLSAEELADWFYDEWLYHLQYRWSSSRGGLIIWLKDRKTEPTCSKMEQVEDEPKTQMKTQNSNLTFEKRKCIDCNFLTYMFGKTWCNIKCENPHDKVCDRFKPKDEPQTEREGE